VIDQRPQAPTGQRRGPGPAPAPASGEDDGRQLASIGLRSLLAGLLAVAFAAVRVPSASLLVMAGVAAVAFDSRKLLSFRNFFITYVVVVFGLGAGLLHLGDTKVFGDAVVYLVAFLAGYLASSFRTTAGARPRALSRRPRRPVPVQPVWTRVRRRGRPRLQSVEAAMVALLVCNAAFLVLQMYKYGPIGYFRGQGLLDQFLTYGQASASGGAEQIVRFVLQYSAVGLVVYYCQACFEVGAPVRYRYPIILLVGVPIVLLRRYDAVVGAVTVAAVYAWDRRISRRPDAFPAVVARRQRAARRGAARAVAIGVAGIAAFTAAFAIGVIRLGFANTGPSGGVRASTVPILSSELTTVQAYSDIKANIDKLRYQHGRTIVLPLLLKLVPRAWLPSKPLNSGGYYMSVVHPREYAAGYAIPPTFFGDLYLNFGLAGAVVGCLALGFLTARFDRAFGAGAARRFPYFLILYANFYAVLREPISESLAGILLIVAVWAAANRLLRSRPVVVRPARRPAVAASPAPA
jgi:hypothetical protein